jgi:uncharacterized membrane protein YhhN
MTPVAWIALAVAAAAAVVDWVACARGNRRLEYVAKPLTMAALAVVAATLDPADPTRRLWFTAAVVFSLAGDVFLMLPRDRFLAGVAAFAVAHVCYLAGLLRGDPSGAGLVLGLVLMAAALVATGRRLLAALRADHPGLVAPVGAYMIVISAMVVAALGYGPPLAAAGALLFATSDSLLAHDRFVQPVRQGHLFVMVTYHLGQAGLVLSLVSPA